ncbi:MAG: hypothetical protein R6U10_03840 [Thermoplasmatota archaeon]
MKKVCVAVILLLLLAPLAHTTGQSGGTATSPNSQLGEMPSLANISSFIHVLPAGIDTFTRQPAVNITMALGQATGNVDMLLSSNQTWLEDAVATFYRLHDISVSRSQQDRFFQQTAAMPDELRQAIALLLVALNNATVLARQATQQLSDADREFLRQHNQSETELGEMIRNMLGRQFNILPDFSLFKSNTSTLFAIIEKIDTEKLVEGSLHMLRAVRIAMPVIAGYTGYNHTLRDPSGRICIGGAGNDTYTGNVSLVVDVGGDDIYTPCEVGEATLRIDVDGNDHYLGSAASSFLGIGMLYDVAGDDVYDTDSWSQSYACGGITVLIDGAGRDSYTGGSYAQACAHAGGIAVLLDIGGSDVYRAGNHSQACSNANGIALLLDVTGDDSYTGGSYVQGSATAGGIALLLDCLGDDVYASAANAQGAGEGWAAGLTKVSTGLMIDVAGNDRYRATSRAQGYGIYAGVGCLTDLLGDDDYRASRSSQSYGTLFGIAMLMDFEGGNSYRQDTPSPGEREGGTSIKIDDVSSLPSETLLSLLGYIRDHDIMPLSSFLELFR